MGRLLDGFVGRYNTAFMNKDSLSLEQAYSILINAIDHLLYRYPYLVFPELDSLLDMDLLPRARYADGTR